MRSSSAAVTRATVAGVVTVGWRRAVGDSTPAAEHSEGPAWASTAWLLADLLDFAADENGTTAKLTDSLFAKLLEEDAQ